MSGTTISDFSVIPTRPYEWENPAIRCRTGFNGRPKPLTPQPLAAALLLMGQSSVHVKLRCVECKAKFDSKYDAIDTSVITSVGQTLPNFIFCERCGKRVSVVVVETR